MTKKQKKLIAEIIPAIKLPQNITQVFSYAVPDKFENKIKIGMIAKIPFRNKRILGAVYSLNKEKPGKRKYKLKSVEDLPDNSLGLSKEQIKLAEYISSYYCASFGLVIKTIIPPIVKNSPRKEIKLNPDCKIAEIKKTEANKPLKKTNGKEKMLLVHNLQSERHQLYCEIIKKEIKGSGQALLLLPEFFDIYNFAKFYLDKFGQKKTAVITSELTKNQYFREWKKIKEGTAKVIVGTRQAVFAPFSNLKLIIADDEHSSSYKQWDMNPRYHAVITAEKLAEIWKAKIILSSPAPSVESYYKAINKQETPSLDPRLSKNSKKSAFCHSREDRNPVNLSSRCIGDKPNFYLLDSRSESRMTIVGQSKKHNISPNKRDWEIKKNNKHFEIINLEEERKAGNYSVLSEKLKSDLLDSVYKRKQAIIFIPRLGESTITKCRDCGYIAECENCHSVLMPQKDRFYCARCKENFELIKECPKCHGQKISSFGYGSEKVEKEIKKLFKDKNIKISRLDSNIAKNKSKQFQIYKDFINKKIEIMVGTQMILKNWNLENLSLIAVLLPEIIFNQPDFRSQEKAFQFLMFLRNLASQETKVVIQSYKTENEIFKIIKNNDMEKFYFQELQNRKSVSRIGYPPFSQFIKLIYKNPDSQKCESEARNLFLILKSKIESGKEFNENFEIMPPFSASNYKEYGKYRWHIIIKSVCEDIKTRDLLLNFAKKDWIVDVDPVEIL